MPSLPIASPILLAHQVAPGFITVQQRFGWLCVWHMYFSR